MLRYALAFVAFVAVMIFAPRRTEPLLMCGMTFRTKTGQPGMTSIGFVLLVAVPLATYFVTGWLARAWQRWGRAERRPPRSRDR